MKPSFLNKINILPIRSLASLRYYSDSAQIRSELIHPTCSTHYTISPIRSVPTTIVRPSYVNSSFNFFTPTKLIIKTPEEVEALRKSCKLVAFIRSSLKAIIKPGITTDSIDEHCHNMIISHNAYPSCLGYSNFPKSVATSVNDIVCHGIPNDRPLYDGDIVNVDLTIYKYGVHADCSATFIVGNSCDEGSKQLIKTAYRVLKSGIKACKPGASFSDIGMAIASSVGQYHIVRDYCGHGIGRDFHELPLILHFPNNNNDIKMKPNMVFTIEPMINEESDEVVTCEDGWSVRTKNGKRSAQFEEVILITEDGAEVLTL